MHMPLLAVAAAPLQKQHSALLTPIRCPHFGQKWRTSFWLGHNPGTKHIHEKAQKPKRNQSLSLSVFANRREVYLSKVRKNVRELLAALAGP